MDISLKLSQIYKESQKSTMKPKLAFLSVRLLKRLIVPTLSVRHNVKQNLIQKSMIGKKMALAVKKISSNTNCSQKKS